MQESNKVKQDEFQVGDDVWCVLHGKGKVTSVAAQDATFPIEVTYANEDYNWYTFDGRFDEDGPRALFFSEPKIEASVTRPFVPTLVGKRVVVRQKACYDVLLTITFETLDVFGNEGYTFDKCLVEVYEVSSENLLKP